MKLVGLDLDELLEQEEEPGLGNGGLGRLAACFLDSMATLGVASISHGVRYEFGIFNQAIQDGWQVELTDKWLRLGNPWEIPRPEIVFDVKFGGRTEHVTENGVLKVRWIPHEVVRGMACDTPVVGYRNETVNLLRLWKAEAAESFDFQAFNTGDYYGAVMEKVKSENITKVLYPNDVTLQGKKLRLQQQYFFVSCALQDIIRIYLQRAIDVRRTGRQVGRPAERHAPVDRRRRADAPAGRRARGGVGAGLGDDAEDPRLHQPHAAARGAGAVADPAVRQPAAAAPRDHLRDQPAVPRPGPPRLSRQTRRGCAACRSSTRPATATSAWRTSPAWGATPSTAWRALHSDLLKTGLLRDFFEIAPEKFSNKTNGVTPRRFLVLSNPGLTALITRRIGDGFVRHLDELRRLEPLAEDAGFRAEWRAVKRHNKALLARLVRARTGIEIDVDSLFDIQVKRLHEYKRQLLNVLHIVTLYNRARRDPAAAIQPRTFVFGGKAAPGYYQAKLIIKLINSVADVVNGDAAVGGRLRVVYFPNFNVKSAHRIYPAAELSEQISTAGLEASGTGNMKFAMNGALTIGTLDGANVEIRDQVGAENFFLFGLTAAEVVELKKAGYRPRAFYEADAELRDVIDQIGARPLLAGRAGPLPAAGRFAPELGRVHAPGRLPRVRRLPGSGEPGVRGPGALDADVDPERRADRLLLVGPHHPRVLPRHLGRVREIGVGSDYRSDSVW